ncbi:molybdopterin-dependent oxidoreductase [Desulfovibrio sulfodismutans]|uniref:Molybdopterin-dependent oxidoreductase n=1 Tax=Desulfolutivibrio sulfodismutans TaxID=63561 RepID=A0A7K3NKL5_9BACT|nr:molybdopterin-dependent oxidoreductase [Desulfolutivibrio sulfodismutans]NDY56741.1 molybdopterin-dependent oxidoreductase [Desulfolutivibrio sulfodismutans]
MGDQFLRTICQFCHNNCGLLVRKSTSGHLLIHGDPEHPSNRGWCCPKAQANAEILLADDRLKRPLRKTRAGFQRISWDEALDYAADRLGEILAKHGPLSLARCTGAPVSYHSRDGFLQFMGEVGSPNLTGIGNLCMAPRMTAYRAVTGGARTEPDYDATNLAIFWGADPVGVKRFASYAAHGGMNRILPRLKERGVKIICIDPYFSATAQEADQWIRINPGTDTALGLAMIHVLVANEIYDKEFVAGYSVGLAELAGHVRDCTPEWAEGLTGIPAGVIDMLARTYAATKPAVIYEGNGLDMYANGVDAVRTIATLVCLAGNLDVPGGNVFMPFPHPAPLPTKALPINRRVWFDRFPLLPHVPFPAIKEAILGGEHNRPRAMIVHHGNPVLVQANEQRTRVALEKLDFLLVTELFPTATTELADLVLPMASAFECYGYRAYSSVAGGFFALARPIVEPVGDARPVFDVEYALASRMGLHRDYPFQDDRGWVDYMVKAHGVTVRRLEEEQIVFALPGVRYRKYTDSPCGTPSGKVEFFSRWFAQAGARPMPIYEEPAGESLSRDRCLEKGFPLRGTSRRPSQFVHTKFKTLDAITKSYPEPLVRMHPDDAVVRGVLEGEMVKVTSPQGTITVKARLSERTSPGLVWVDFGWGNPSDGKANINVLCNDGLFDPVSGGTPNRLFPCEVQKARVSEPKE